MSLSSKSLTSRLELGLNDSIEYLRKSDASKKGEESNNKTSSTEDVSSEDKNASKPLSKFKI